LVLAASEATILWYPSVAVGWTQLKFVAPAG
jgi:hypothetical protein